ncbi:hypothetical protein QE152_g37720 [Popillia japonica]|uniref:Uncharacterized protein n=1 Tax=Popillia japonica TaxID=7064 RepID=A0AAW1I982_POPJA
MRFKKSLVILQSTSMQLTLKSLKQNIFIPDKVRLPVEKESTIYERLTQKKPPPSQALFFTFRLRSISLLNQSNSVPTFWCFM